MPIAPVPRLPAAEPRPAASLIVLRRPGGSRPPEILMARRSAHHRFMPNVMVFPGGAVDPQDYDAVVATGLDPGVRARLERGADARLAHALAVAAARELTEEVHLSLGTPPALDGLAYLCRAITPADRPIRFDARFFIVDAARLSGIAAGSAELEEPGWYDLQAALGTHIAGATRAVLGQLRLWLSCPAQLEVVPTLRERLWLHE